MSGATLLYQGADQPEYRSFGIDQAETAGGRFAVRQGALGKTPFFTLRTLCVDDRGVRTPMLVIPPLSGHFPLLLRDMIVGLLPDFDISVLDWANVRHVPVSSGAFGFDDNIAAVRDAIRKLGPTVSVIALCQAAVPALAAVSDLCAVAPEYAPAALVLLGAPVDPLANPTTVVRYIRGHTADWYNVVPLARVSSDHDGHGRWVYPAETQLAALKLFLARQIEGKTELARKLETDDGADPGRFPFLDLYTSTMDIDARHFVENLDRVFLSRCLPQGELEFHGRRVDLGAIRQTALATIEGALDEIAAPGQTAAAHGLCSRVPEALRLRHVVPGCGHFSLFHGEVWRRHVLPVVREFCWRHSAQADGGRQPPR